MLCNDMRTVETFKDRLRKAAHYAGVECSQTAIGRSLGTNKQTVDRWFGGSVPRPAMIFHIANTWRVDARWLTTGEGEMIPGPTEGLSKPEREIIQSYRSAEPDRKTSLRSIVKAFGRVSMVCMAVALSSPDASAFSRHVGTAVYFVKSAFRRLLTRFQQLRAYRIAKA